MKPFNEMTSFEIDKMSREEFKYVSPFDKKSCFDCGNLKQALSLWCGSAAARKARGTGIPGCIKCPYWKPDWNYIDEKYKTEEFGYVEQSIIKNINKTSQSLIHKIKNRFNTWKNKH